MGRISGRSSVGLAFFCACLFVTVSAWGVVLHTDDQPVDHPNDAVVGAWSTNASCVAISPNYIITTRHQGGGVGSTVTFDGVTYKIADVSNNGSVDMRVARLETLDGQPANLDSYVGIYSGGSEIGQSIVMGGYGNGRGTTLTTSRNGKVYGYEWDKSSNTTLRWGTNTVDGSLSSYAVLSYASNVLRADFDGPGAAGATSYEAAIADHDSGGGWFIQEDGEWQLIGLNAYVEHLWESWFANETSGISDPDMLLSIQINSYSTWIEANISSVVVMPGDADWDGVVDVGDLGVLAANYGESGKSWQEGDFNADGVVDVGDLGILAANYGSGNLEGVSALETNIVSIPEPATFVFILTGFAGMLFGLRRRRH